MRKEILLSTACAFFLVFGAMAMSTMGCSGNDDSGSTDSATDEGDDGDDSADGKGGGPPTTDGDNGSEAGQTADDQATTVGTTTVGSDEPGETDDGTTDTGGPCGNVELCGNGNCVRSCGECGSEEQANKGGCPADCGKDGDPKAEEKCTGTPEPPEVDPWEPCWVSCAKAGVSAIVTSTSCTAGCWAPEPTDITKAACAACLSGLVNAATGLHQQVADCVCCMSGCISYVGGPAAGYCADCPKIEGPPDPCSVPNSKGMPGMGCNATTGCCPIKDEAGVTLTCSGISVIMALNPLAKQTPDRCAFGSCTSNCAQPSDSSQCHQDTAGKFQTCDVDPATGCSSWGPGKLCVNGQDTCSDHPTACATGGCGHQQCTKGQMICNPEKADIFHECEPLPAPIGCIQWSAEKTCLNSDSGFTCAEDKLGCTGSP